jgi:hypothetical protein
VYLVDFYILIYGPFMMTLTNFCKFIHDLRSECFSRNEMARRYPWHVNTIKAYELDRLPDVDYLFALSESSGFDFYKLIEMRLQVGVLKELGLDFTGNKKHLAPPTPAEDTIHPFIPPNAVRYSITDTSMAPTINKDSVFFVDTSNKIFNEDGIFAVVVYDKVVPRRFQFGVDKKVMIVCDNPRFVTITLSAKAAQHLDIIGQVVATLNPL